MGIGTITLNINVIRARDSDYSAISAGEKKKKIWNLNVITCRALKIEEKKYYKDCCLVLASIGVPKRQMSTGGIETKGTCSCLSTCM